MTAMHIPRRLCALTLLPLALAGCQLLPGHDRPPVPVEPALSEVTPDGCSGERCPLVNIETQHFPSEPALERLVDERLRRMTQYGPEDALPESLESYRRDFLASAEPGWSTWLQAKLRDWHDGMLVVELSSYLFQGGAHGMPGRGFINYDMAQDRELKLQDWVVPGREGAFWREAQAAHQRWLEAQELGDDAAFQRMWPFQRTANIALLRDRVLLKYDVYSLAPYSYGHPELEIGYDRLEGILRDEYLP